VAHLHRIEQKLPVRHSPKQVADPEYCPLFHAELGEKFVHIDADATLLVDCSKKFRNTSGRQGHMSQTRIASADTKRLMEGHC
jgi:hypothetical protein